MKQRPRLQAPSPNDSGRIPATGALDSDLNSWGLGSPLHHHHHHQGNATQLRIAASPVLLFFFFLLLASPLLPLLASASASATSHSAPPAGRRQSSRRHRRRPQDGPLAISSFSTRGPALDSEGPGPGSLQGTLLVSPRLGCYHLAQAAWPVLALCPVPHLLRLNPVPLCQPSFVTSDLHAAP